MALARKLADAYAEWADESLELAREMFPAAVETFGVDPPDQQLADWERDLLDREALADEMADPFHRAYAMARGHNAFGGAYPPGDPDITPHIHRYAVRAGLVAVIERLQRRLGETTIDNP